MATEVLIQTEDVVDFAKVNGFRQDGHFCDTEIRTSDGERLAAHACVVAAGSPVLRRLLLKQTKLRRALVVRGKDVSVCGAIWRVVLQLMYTGRAFVTIARLADLLLAAETLQIDRLRSLCASLLDDIDPDIDVDVGELPELLNVANGKSGLSVDEDDTKCWTSVEANVNGTFPRYSDEAVYAAQYGLASVKLEPPSDFDDVELPATQNNGDGLFNVETSEKKYPADFHFTHVKVEQTDADDRKPMITGNVAIHAERNGHVARRKGLHPQRRSSVDSEVLQNTLSPIRIWDRSGADMPPEVGQQASKRHHCGVCGRVFRHASNLDRHRRRDVTCRRVTLATGVVRRRREKRPGQFRCRVCGFAFNSRASLQRHRRTHAVVTSPVTSDVAIDVHDDDVMEDRRESPPRNADQETAEADTDMSSWLYPTETENTVDESFASSLFSTTTKPVAPRCVVLVSDDELKLYECTICGKSFNSSKNIRRHERTHLPREVRFAKRIQNAALAAMRRMHREYHCSICGKQFPNGKNISRHKKTHHKAEVLPDPTITPSDNGASCTCQTCGKTFPSRRNLRCHEARAHGANARTSTPKANRKSSQDRKPTPDQKPPVSSPASVNKQSCNTPAADDVKPPRTYSCSVCARVFASGKNIRRHERSHRQEKRYKCETCGKHFAQSTTLVYHERIHTGEKPHVCRVCGNAYRFPTVLARHERTHNVELTAAYECPTCGRGFSRRSGLDRHRCSNQATTAANEEDVTFGDVAPAKDITDGDVCPEVVAL